uniref:PLAC domain-containing protein n=1 Tax=Cyclopterus lumpus TaxID=8103 RepID=A0A8C2Z3I9_CYCLU
CSQTCGVGVSQRSRTCLPPPPPISHPPPNWAGYLPGGIGGPVISPGLPARRSSAIRPGQFGYGRVPFSLPLHRPNRQARHTVNGTDAETSPAERAPPSHFFSRSSSPALLPKRHRFDWHSVTAPPPPIPPLSRPNSPAVAPPFSSPLHRSSPMHRDRELQPGFSPHVPPTGDIYPLQHPHIPHLGVESGRDGGRAAPQVIRCSGPEKEYRRCFSQVCGGGVLDSRAEQCAAFNTKEFMGRLYNWEPFTEVGADKQCELTCRPSGYRFYVRQAERVRDGTPCFNISSNDVCVEGRCLTEGCDGVLGSGSVIDKCGVCGGRESSCRKVTGSFQNVSVPIGYHKILDIPPGATFINITERRASPNYLAMRSGTGASVVNGRWAVDPPGEYQAAGTTFTYTRPRAQAEGEEEKGESLGAPGPTTTQLQLYVRTVFSLTLKENTSQGPLTVSIEEPPPAPPPISVPSFPSSSSTSLFSPPSSDRLTPERSRPRGSGPNRNARFPPRTDLPPDTQPPFVWRRGGLTECSASCGRGSQNRVILCINRHTDEEVPERKCDSAAKPVPEEEPCNTHPCPPFWEASSWSECSVSCGPGVQQRQLQCRQSFGNRSTMVHPQRCANLTPPESTQACQIGLCSHWEVSSDWSACSVDCGVGRRTRSVRCLSDQGSVVNEKECNSRARPQGSEECNMGPCVINWYFTDFSNTCSALCGPGVQRREVVCLTRGAVREGGGGGDCVGDKPAEMKACNGGPCVPTTMWYSSPWTQCNVPCGNGTQRRDIICVQKIGNDFTVAPANECAHLEKPAAVQQCEMGECEPQWFTTEWSACSRSCGKGLQMREVRCLETEKKHSHECDLSTKPEREQICNTIPCSPQVADENCRDRRHNCVVVVQARMCVYTYYKTACCASCTQSAQIRSKADPPEIQSL